MAVRFAASRWLLTLLLLLLLLTLLMPLATVEASNKPVLIVHGLFDDPEHLQALRGYIEEAHPGTNVTVFSLFNNMESLKPLWSQVKGFGAMMGPIMQEAPDGVHIICYSQGGLVCRGVLSIMPNHNVDTFISLSSPQAGQYGVQVTPVANRDVVFSACSLSWPDTNYLWWLFPKYVKSTLFHFCYTELGQDVSICNYWKDPHHLGDYLKSSQFLSFLNNEREHASAAEWKKNFLRINRLVLIGGPDDGVITPWQSSHFGFYDGNETVQEMKDQEVYQRDMFGLRTLDERGALTVYEVPGVTHTSWHSNRTVFDRYISKWLS